MPDKAHFYPSQLSGGQQQRAAIARSLCMNPQDHAVRRADLGARSRAGARGSRYDDATRQRRNDDGVRHARDGLRTAGRGPRHLHGCRAHRRNGARRRSSSAIPRRAAPGHSSARSFTDGDASPAVRRSRRNKPTSGSTLAIQTTTRGSKMMTSFKSLRCAIASLGFLVSVASQPSLAYAQGLPPLPQAIKDAGVIRIGVKCDSPPFGSSGPDGKPVGIEVDMAKQIGVYAFGSPDKAELSCVATDARIPSLTGKKIDLILATLGKTPPREQVIDYSNIYYWGSSNVAVPEGQPGPEPGRPEGQVDPDRQGREPDQVAARQYPWRPVRPAQHGIRQPSGPAAGPGRRLRFRWHHDGAAEQQLSEPAHPQGRGGRRHQRRRHPQERTRAQGLRERGAEEDEGREVLHQGGEDPRLRSQRCRRR